MDVAEHRRPRDGRWLYQIADDHTIDLRVNTVPTLHGEDMTMRVLDRKTRLLKVESLGLLKREFFNLQKLVGSPAGLVLVTLHAPVAAGAIQSMLGMGVAPHFLASCLNGVIAQRLVQTLCRECRVAYPLDEVAVSFDDVRPFLETGEGESIYGAKGCPACKMLGYDGRSGLFEVLTVTPAIRQMILKSMPLQQIRRQAVADGMMEFRQTALLKVAQGVTSVEQVFQAVPSEYLFAEDAAT